MSWTQPHSGRAFDLVHPRAEDVDFADVAWHLARVFRFNGATERTYTVAQHSVQVAIEIDNLVDAGDLPPEAAGYALLHDGHEFVLGDDVTPKRRGIEAIAREVLGDEVAEMLGAVIAIQRYRIDGAIHAAAGLPFPVPTAIQTAIKHYDLRVLMTERRDLMKAPPKPWAPELEAVAPLPAPIAAIGITGSEGLFLHACRRWLPAMKEKSR